MKKEEDANKRTIDKMKFFITFKTPDAVQRFVDNYLEDLTPEPAEVAEYDEDPEGWYQQKGEEIKRFVEKWVAYGEVVVLEFDTDAKTAKVLETD